MKTCTKCGVKKSIIDFAKNKSKPDGLQAHCRECKKLNDARHYAANKEKQQERNQRNKQLCIQEMNEYKAERGCCLCDETDPCCLDFHHPNEDKDLSVSVFAWTACRNKMWAEIEKCVIVCANCHRKVHAGKATI